MWCPTNFGGTPTALWHNRLGHASIGKMKHVSAIPHHVFQSATKVCLTCPLAKITKLPFPHSMTQSSSAFELRYLGPYRVPIKENYRFFLTIMDDCSGATWIYLLKYKSQSLTTLRTFLSFVRTQFGVEIKQIRFDNALVFDSGPCQVFFAEKDIHHQTTCIDRPQQNGVDERKHRHILEIARSLRFQSGLRCIFGVILC